MSLFVAVEGDTDMPVVQQLVADAGLEPGTSIVCEGKSNLDAGLARYNAAAQQMPWLVLRDLDHDATCAVDFLKGLRFKPSPWMCFRLAVRATESWLMADAAALAGFLAVDERWIATEPDSIANPKVALVDLARRSRKAQVRRAMTPPQGASVSVGPLYAANIIDFATNHWSLERACKRSESLRRARKALRALGSRWRHYVGIRE